jgi:hypothetical protein
VKLTDLRGRGGIYNYKKVGDFLLFFFI